MTTSPLTLIDPVDAASPAWPDDVVDLTDRRRLLLRTLLGVDVAPRDADLVFVAQASSSPSTTSPSTTSRSAGRDSSTEDR